MRVLAFQCVFGCIGKAINRAFAGFCCERNKGKDSLGIVMMNELVVEICKS